MIVIIEKLPPPNGNHWKGTIRCGVFRYVVFEFDKNVLWRTLCKTIDDLEQDDGKEEVMKE